MEMLELPRLGTLRFSSKFLSNLCLLYHLVECQCCSNSIWNTPLISWNAKRVLPAATMDKNLLLCGLCLNQYKHTQEFCTICFKLYNEASNMDSESLFIYLLNLCHLHFSVYCMPPCREENRARKFVYRHF